MKFQELKALNQEMSSVREPKPRHKLVPVINLLFPTQKYLIISSDPSLDTDKTKANLEKHSGFEERILALVFFGSDNDISVNRIRESYQKFKSKFLKHFYWTHYSKTYAAGNPGGFWVKRFLLKEIQLFEPKTIITFGGLVTNYLIGRGKLVERVNQILHWRDVPVICSLHPSRDWNLKKRPQYKFAQTWKLIRKMCPIT